MSKIEFGITFDGTLLIKPNCHPNEYSDIQKWVMNNCNNRICSEYRENRPCDLFFVFKDETDAMAFKLRWL